MEEVRPQPKVKAQTQNAVKRPILSPIAGAVLMTHAVEVQMVSINQPLTMMADLSKTYVLAYIDEAEIKNIRVGQRADVQLASDSDRMMAFMPK